MVDKKILVGDFEIASCFQLDKLPERRCVINTINAYSWVMADKDLLFRQSLIESDYLLPDGIAVVWAARFLKKERIQKIAGADLHQMVLETLERQSGKCFYLGASEATLSKIKERLSYEYPHIEVSTYSPPFKATFSEEDNQEIDKASQ